MLHKSFAMQSTVRRRHHLMLYAYCIVQRTACRFSPIQLLPNTSPLALLFTSILHRAIQNKKAQLTQGLRATVPPPSVCVRSSTRHICDESRTFAPPVRQRKFRRKLERSRSRSSKVIDLRSNRKRICKFVLVVNSNFGRILYSFRDIDTQSQKIRYFPHPIFV